MRQPTPPHRQEDFEPAWWLRNPHGQTVYAALWGPTVPLTWQRECWPTPDGDSLEISLLSGWDDAPALILFHGFEGSAESRYIRQLAWFAQQRGWHVVAPTWRGCGQMPNSKPRLYHAGDSAEIHWIVQRVSQQLPRAKRFAVGFSLGANMLLKWLGEQADEAIQWVDRCAAVATPFDLTLVGDHLAQGFNRLYTHHFLSTLKIKARTKHQQFPRLFDLEATLTATTLRQFDDHCMAPMHGFRDAEDYWRQSSCRPLLAGIRCPTMLLQAADDPFTPPEALPSRHQLPPIITWNLQRHGGHIGFISGLSAAHNHWMPQHILHYFTSQQEP